MFITGTIDTFGKPINCLVPTEFSCTYFYHQHIVIRKSPCLAHWAEHVHQYCYVIGTYLKETNGDRIFVDYYQWVTFALVVLAVAMNLPYFLWRYGETNTGNAEGRGWR
jgi:hypothetical protein